MRWIELSLHNLNLPEKNIFISNLFLIACCVFYLIWWLLAFRPNGGITGMKAGWLLIPASAAGLVALILAVRGLLSAPTGALLFSGKALLWGGIAAYVILFVLTRLLLGRPVTTELFLIVGWAVLVLSEVNTLFGWGLFSHRLTITLMAVIGVAALAGLVCYVLYYRLEALAGYIDGMLPLLIIAVVMAGLAAVMLKK